MNSKGVDLERRRLLGKPDATPRPALFMDRDGVLIEDKHHLCEPAEVELCVGTEMLLESAAEAGWPVVVVTNQSGISRALFEWHDYEMVTDQILSLLVDQRLISGIYANGHGPEASSTSWRKPSPAMLEAAAKDLNLDLFSSVLVGDRLSDLMAGERAGVPRLCHVMSGHGKAERRNVVAWSEKRQLLEQATKSETFYFEDLLGVRDAFEEWQN